MQNELSKQKVALGLSGGVDSTAAALLLKQEGYEVIGVFLDVLGNNEDGKKSAMSLAEKLKIELICVDASEDFSEIVISNFCNEYMQGRTPNPCILCNPTVKFKYLQKVADEAGAYYMATGHYANIVYDEAENCHFISKAKNIKKDQSYMLYRLNAGVLFRLKFPLGNFESKEDVRSFVEEKGLKNARQKDSQEICFIPDEIHYIDYLLSRGYKITDGQFINSAGEQLGKHKGVPNYTIGQRKNLGITFGKPMFVVNLDGKTNEVTLGEHDELMKTEVISVNNCFPLTDVNSANNNFIDAKAEAKVSSLMPYNYIGKTIQAKVRYAATPANATLKQINDDTICAVFEVPQRAIAPGQSIVFYDGDKVIGGGIINE